MKEAAKPAAVPLPPVPASFGPVSDSLTAKGPGTRPSCLNCTMKHTAWAWIIADVLLKGLPKVTTWELMARAEVLWVESRHGYPMHRWLSLGCLALCSHILTLNGRQHDAERVKQHQKLLEMTPIMWDTATKEGIPDIPYMVRGADIHAHLAEALSESAAEFPVIAEMIRRQLVFHSLRGSSVPQGLLAIITAIDSNMETASTTGGIVK